MKAILALDNGEIFEGTLLGTQSEAIGEIAITSASTGYQEIITDPSFFGTLTCFSTPVLGTYGFNSEDDYGAAACRGIITHAVEDKPSNFRSEWAADEYFKRKKITCINEVDTRRLTAVIRDNGTMCGIIMPEARFSRELAESKLKENKNVSALIATTTRVARIYGSGSVNIAVIDLGATPALIRALESRGCKVTLIPYLYDFNALSLKKPDGIIIAGGGASPDECAPVFPLIKTLFDTRLPVLAIGLGHNVVAAALGYSCTKLQTGVYDAIPVRCTVDGRIFIANCAHAYGVSSVPDGATVSFSTTHSDEILGINYGNAKSSVQFHPEYGHTDTLFVLDEFVKTVKNSI